MENKPNHPFLEKWEQIRSKGRLRYTLLNGGSFGVFIFVLTGIFELGENSFSDIFLGPGTLYQLASWVIGGMISYGTIVWWMNERMYHKMKNQ